MFKRDFMRHKTLSDKLIGLLFYSGVQALVLYRLSNLFFRTGEKQRVGMLRFFFRLLARSVYRFNIWFTGADIAFSCRIGSGVVIYHSVGIVIGETAEIGNNVKIMHGITLGAVRTEMKGQRHPIVGDDVMLGARCIVLGNIRIGNGASIGAGSVVTKPVPDGATVVGNPATMLERQT